MVLKKNTIKYTLSIIFNLNYIFINDKRNKEEKKNKI